MRIGIRAAARTSGGGLAFVTNLMAALAADPRCSSVTLFRMGKSASSATNGEEVTVDLPGDPIRRRLVARRALGRAVRSHPIDVMVSPGTETTRVAGTPTLMWPLTVAPFEPAAIDRLGLTGAQRLRWMALRRSIQLACYEADGFLFSSHYARALYVEHVPRVAARTSVVIPPAATVTPAWSNPSPSVVDRPPYVLFVSHLYPYKMVVETVQGWALARDRGLLHELVIAGGRVNERYARAVDDAVAGCGHAGAVRLLGHVDHEALAALYRGADAFLFPSLSENAGSFAVIDAFGFGLPVLASCMSSVPEACQDAARYFDPRDPGHLALELGRLFENDELRADLARRSMRRAGEYTGWAEVAGRLLTFADKVEAGAHRG